MVSKENHKILVSEWDKLVVGQTYDEVEFTASTLKALGRYEVSQPGFEFYKTYINQVRFCQYVGVIKIGDLTIEVLPKTDRHELAKAEWQKVLLEMLLISLQVEAKTTTQANITIRQHSVLDTYLQLFVDEAERLIHQGLVKKYRTHISNQPALKGKLLVHKQITHHAVHAERFYVAHQVYDQDNVYNFILKVALECIADVGSLSVAQEAQALLLFFPDCKPVKIDEKLFERLAYDRKTEGYKRAIELARIILLNYHPDLKGGSNDILATMFDMNMLWESFITWSLRRAGRSEGVKVYSQSSKSFWKPEGGYSRTLRPDIILEKEGDWRMIIDTKWKYQSSVSLNDLRQIYAYLKYFDAEEGYLLYPDRLEDKVQLRAGEYSNSDLSCGLVFADLIQGTELNKKIGGEILKELKGESSLSLQKVSNSR